VATSRREEQRRELLELRFTFEEFGQAHFGGSDVSNGQRCAITLSNVWSRAGRVAILAKGV
jgi:hypothetical protein